MVPHRWRVYKKQQQQDSTSEGSQLLIGPVDTRLTMMYCKFLMLAMLVGTALGDARPWPLASRPPLQGLCDHWCGTPPDLVCCDTKCPVDNRKPGDCNRPLHSPGAGGFVSGPLPCSRDLDCHAGALCCWDSCLQYKKCTNV